MFIASKLIQTLLQPSNVLGGLILLAFLSVLFSRRRLANLTLSLAVVLVVLCVSPLSPLALQTLEDRIVAPGLPQTVTGIIMLGGAVNTHLTADRGQVALNDNAERVTTTAMLARQFPSARVLLAGGAVELLRGVPVTKSEGARRVLVELGIENDRIVLEEKSRTTFENAVESLALAGPQLGEIWVLVTSAYNMPRAVASFRAVGFPVIPYPVDFRTRPADLSRPVSSLASGLYFADMAAHEWLGLRFYWLTGKTKEFFPA